MQNQASLDIQQSLKIDQSLTYWKLLIGQLLRFNAQQLRERILQEAERNACLEVEYHSFRGEFSMDLLMDRSFDFRQDLRLQLPYKNHSLLYKAACTIINLLDERAYFHEQIDDLCKQDKKQEKLFRLALNMIQNLEPAGVGARSVRECYLLQLKRKGLEKGDAWLLLSDHFEALRSKTLHAIVKKLGWDEKRLKKALETISKLSTNPIQNDKELVAAVIPDLEIKETDGHLHVRLLEESLPRLTINPAYIMGSREKLSSQFAKRGIFYASRFLYCLSQRNETLLHIIRLAVFHQEDYIRKGVRKQIKMKDVAAELGFHPSTVTRAVSHKYILMNKKVFAARKLFVANGVADISKEEIQAALYKHIQNESSSAPLSDECLHKILNQEGYPIARRTVAKYRQEIGIVSAKGRKKQ